MSEPHTIDYDSFYQRLLTGVRATWNDLRAARPAETICLFGLSTDSDTTDLALFANTEEQFARENDAPESPFLKWCVNEESELHQIGREHIDDLAKEINRFVFESETDEAFEDRKTKLLQIFEQVLADLDTEGLFGQETERQHLILLLDIVDAEEEEWEFMLEVLQRINPPESVKTYLQLLQELREE